MAWSVVSATSTTARSIARRSRSPRAPSSTRSSAPSTLNLQHVDPLDSVLSTVVVQRGGVDLDLVPRHQPALLEVYAAGGECRPRLEAFSVVGEQRRAGGVGDCERVDGDTLLAVELQGAPQPPQRAGARLERVDAAAGEHGSGQQRRERADARSDVDGRHARPCIAGHERQLAALEMAAVAAEREHLLDGLELEGDAARIAHDHR